MSSLLRAQGLTEHFPELHHFSSSSFASPPLSLDKFCDYCDAKSRFVPAGENPQTIRRATAFARAYVGGASIEAARAEAWRDYPLVTR